MKKLIKLIGVFPLLISFCLTECVRHEIVEPVPTTTVTAATTTTTTTTLPPEPDFSKKDMLAVYNTLVDNIKKRNVDAIMPCYTDDASYFFSDMTRADFVCYNGTKRVDGADEIRANYNDRFRRIKKDRIEYEVQKVNTDYNNPYIIFVNAWDNADFSHYEMITFKKTDNGIAISEHKVVKSKEVRPFLYKDNDKK